MKGSVRESLEGGGGNQRITENSYRFSVVSLKKKTKITRENTYGRGCLTVNSRLATYELADEHSRAGVIRLYLTLRQRVCWVGENLPVWWNYLCGRWIWKGIISPIQRVFWFGSCIANRWRGSRHGGRWPSARVSPFIDWRWTGTIYIHILWSIHRTQVAPM